MPTSPEYDAILARKLAERQKEREAHGNISSVKMTEAETAKEIEEITGGVFIQPVPIIEPTAAELDIIAATVLQPKKRRGRPPGSKNRKKDTK